MITDFGRWRFDAGMKFGDMDSWWEFGVARKEAHNGVDLYRYTDKYGCDKSITAGTKIANIYGGEVAAIRRDHICSSIFVKHDIFTKNISNERLQYYTIFGHIKVSDGLKQKDLISSGVILGEVAEVPSVSRAYPHLHLSMAWLPADIQPCFLNWPDLGGRFFINPL
jgi:hypothetical protein